MQYAKRTWNDAFDALKDNNSQPILLYLGNAWFKIDEALFNIAPITGSQSH